MTGRQPLTEIAQAHWLPYLAEGDWTIDGTAGNGFDTQFLAKAVGPQGRVFAFDIQQSAIASTADRLAKADLLERVTLIREDHSRMREVLACGSRGRISLICFNLGYLPTGDHDIRTCPESTLAALHEALLLLKPGGALSVIAYRGHPGGLEEAQIVETFFQKLPHPWKCTESVASGSEDRPGPVWWMATSDQDQPR